MKVYLVVHTFSEFPTEIDVYNSREKAENGFYGVLGREIADCISNNDVEEAIAYVKEFKSSDGQEFYFYSPNEELYIEEREVM